MSAADSFMLLACILFFGVPAFLIWNAKENKKAKNARTVFEKNRNENQEELIRTAFALADQHGGMWRISFSSAGITIYKKAGGQKYYSLEELGYSNLNLDARITYHGHFYKEFPYRLKIAAESRGYLFWTEKGYAFVQGNTYTTYDGGHSYTRDDSAGDFIKAVNVCSIEYFRRYQPYPDPNKPPLKKL